MPPHPFPKLPHALVDDYAPTGPLYDIVMKASQLREAKNMKALEWRNPQQRNLLMDILRLVRRPSAHPLQCAMLSSAACGAGLCLRQCVVCAQ